MELEFIDRNITAFGGVSLVIEMLKRMDFTKHFEAMPFPQQGSNRGFSPIQLVTGLMTSVWCGANCFEQTEIFRQDEVMRQLFQWDRMPGHRAYKRYFEKFDQATNQRCFTALNQWWFSNLNFDNYTLDFDSTVITRWGEQEGAKLGYNPKHKGRKSHHPLMAFVSGLNMVANCWLRPGNTSDSNGFSTFLLDTLEKMRGKRVGLVRADSGFFSNANLSALESFEKAIPYIVACRFTTPIKRELAWRKTWIQIAPGIEISETTYQAEGWGKARRIILIRQDKTERPKAPGKTLKVSQGLIFPEEFELDRYRFSCYVTNLELPAEVVWRTYRGRADAENRIKEIKADFAMDHFVLKDFWATEAVMNVICLAYNIISLFRTSLINSKVKHQLKTIRYKFFAIPGVIQERSCRIKLKLALPFKRRQSFQSIWDGVKDFSLPKHYKT